MRISIISRKPADAGGGGGGGVGAGRGRASQKVRFGPKASLKHALHPLLSRLLQSGHLELGVIHFNDEDISWPHIDVVKTFGKLLLHPAALHVQRPA